MPAKKIRIAVADDHRLFRKGIMALLEEYDDLNVIFEAEDGQDLLLKMKTQRPNIVLLDLDMPVMNGIQTTKEIKKRYSRCKIIILTMHNDEALVEELLKLGANGFVLKDQDISVVVDAVHSVMKSGYYLNSGISDKLAEKLVRTTAITPLGEAVEFSPREMQIVELLCNHKTNKQIGEMLSLSIRTVDGHINRIFHKTGVRNRTGIVMYVVKHNMLKQQFITE